MLVGCLFVDQVRDEPDVRSAAGRPADPADGVPLPRPAKREQVFLTHGQLESLAEAAGRDRLVILFLGYTGVRYGEMAALRVRNLDLLKRRALIAEAVA